jgi:DNA-binding LacI/PurR family transcriptional regulator
LACQQAIEHLLHLGHRRIAITLNTVDDHDHAERYETYRRTLGEAGVEIDSRLVMRVPAHRDAGAVALRKIMGMPDRPTAVFCTDPFAAVGLMHEAMRMQVGVPQQLSVVGFDDTDSRYGVFPPMSAVCQDTVALGREAFSRLKAVLSGGRADESSNFLEAWLELHDTTGPPPSR